MRYTIIIILSLLSFCNISSATINKPEQIEGNINKISYEYADNKSGLEITYIRCLIFFSISFIILTIIILIIFHKRIIAIGKKNNLNAKRYRILFENAAIGLEYFDKDGILIDMNDTDCNIYGVTDKKSLLKSRLSIYDNPNLKKRLDPKNLKHFSGILKYNLYKETRDKYFSFSSNNDFLYVQADIFPIRDNKGNLESIIFTSIDVTQEYVKEEQQSELSENLTSTLNVSGTFAWTFNPNTKIFNALKGRIVIGNGISLKEMLKKAHPDDRKGQLDLLLEVLRKEKNNVSSIVRYIHADGTYHYYEVVMKARIIDDTVVSITGTQKDITKGYEQKIQLEEYHKKTGLIIDVCDILQLDYDISSKMFFSYNKKELQPNKSLTIDDILKVIYPDDIKIFCEFKKEMDSRTDSILKLKYRAKLPSKEGYRDIIVRAIPLKDNRNVITRYTGLLQDMTEWNNINRQLIEERKKAEESDKLKSAFLANMSHEIRTPLNAIIGFSELLQTVTDESEKSEFVNIINHNNEILLRLIGDILDLSKIEAGMIELKPIDFDLSITFYESYKSLSTKCTNDDVRIICNSNYSQCLVTLDKNRIIQIITNFVTNAIKHTTEGYIEMGYEYINKGIRIYVKDTGSGIPKEKQHLLFQRFSKLDDFTQGTGLGLSICKAIVEMQEGKIGCESTEGKGSTFWAWIPCEAIIKNKNEKQELANEKKAMISDKTINLKIKGKLNILIAEDNDSNFLLTKTFLKDHKLSRACNGEEAVNMAKNKKYDIILMDINMPIMNGLIATQKIREFNKTTMIYALTANAFESDKSAAINAGCNGFIAKPFTYSDLGNIFTK